MRLNKIRKRELCLVDMGQAYEGVETRYTSALRVISSNHPRAQRRRSNAHVSCGFGQWIGCEVLGILLRVCDRDSWGFLQSGTDKCLRILNLPAKVEARNEAFAKIKSPTSKTYGLQCASYRRSSTRTFASLTRSPSQPIPMKRFLCFRTVSRSIRSE